MYYYIAHNKQEGPVDEHQVRALLAGGVIDENTLIWGGRISKWMPISETEFASNRASAEIQVPAEPPPLPSIIGKDHRPGSLHIERIRHPSERVIFYISAAISVLIWVAILRATLGAALLAIPLIAVLGWIAGLFFKAMFYGNAVRISARQHPEISMLVGETAAILGLRTLPELFVYNSGGLMNAFAIRFVGRSHVVLYSALLDNMLLRGAHLELKAIIAHELGHHAAGHTSPWKRLLLLPVYLVPFLSNFYSRCCEYTCDRIAYAVVGDKEAVQRALLTFAHGTRSLAEKSDVSEFCAQEREIPGLVGFYLEVLATHPRITRRIAAVESFASEYAA
ncbi:MAG: DUF4339 domain-containing protein [Verrucomicrobia bacterium]|nr:DUF4339 domain-containing protein [Verrucomicrobiota bacterium]